MALLVVAQLAAIGVVVSTPVTAAPPFGEALSGFDVGFGGDGAISTPDELLEVEISGRLLFDPYYVNPLSRTGYDGTVDTAFETAAAASIASVPGSTGLLQGAAADPAGGYVVWQLLPSITFGQTHDVLLMRLTDDGQIDTGWGFDGLLLLPEPPAEVGGHISSVAKVEFGPLGELFVHGLSLQPPMPTVGLLVKVDADGMVDTAFGRGGFYGGDRSSTERTDVEDFDLAVDDLVVYADEFDGASATGTIHLITATDGEPVSGFVPKRSYYPDQLVVLGDGTIVALQSLFGNTTLLTFEATNAWAATERLLSDADVTTLLPSGGVAFARAVVDSGTGTQSIEVTAEDLDGNPDLTIGIDGVATVTRGLGGELPFPRELQVGGDGNLYLVWQDNAIFENPLQGIGMIRVYPPRFPGIDPIDLANPSVTRPVTSDPVNTATGALVAGAMDLPAPVGSDMLSWERFYDSSRTDATVLGTGWRSNWDARVELDGDDVIYVNEHGARFRFVALEFGSFERPAEIRAYAYRFGDQAFLEWFDGEYWEFDLAGRLSGKFRWDGVGVQAVRSADGELIELSATTGANLALTYEDAPDGSRRVVQVAAADGRSVGYTYDDTGGGPGWLATADAPSGSMAYAHDAGGRIVGESDDTGVVQHQTIYGDDGRVTQQTLSTGEITLFSYDDQLRNTTVIDVASGDQTTYWYGANARLARVTDAAGNDVVTAWSPDGLPAVVADRAGHQTTAAYDSNGNLISQYDPARGETTYTYDFLNRVTSIAEPTGATTTLTYGEFEWLPSTVTDGLGNTTTFEIVAGLVASVTDADGVTVSYGYDAQRRMTSMTNGLGGTWTFGRDAVGRRTSETTPLGFVTSRTFDDAGRMLTSTAADGGVTSYVYETEGRVVSVTDPVGAVVSNSYDPVTGLLATTTDPAGRVTSYTYNSLGELIAVTSNDGAVSETDYGTLGRVTATRDPLGRESTYAYDANGNRTEVVAPDGGVSRTEYDTAGRITALEDPLGRRTSHTYDEFGRLVTVTQSDGTTMSYSYDLLGRRVTVTAPDGGVTSTGFTPAGRTDTVTDPEGGVTSYGYDLAGRLESVTDPHLHTTTIGYDADGRRTAVTTPEGLVTSWEYDPVGRITKIIDPAGVSMTRTYTLRGEVQTEQRSGDGQVAYVYNLDGTLASVTDAVGHTTSFTYDAAGRRATRIDATGAVEAWDYNPAGELVAQTDRLGNQTTVGYDPNGRIESVVDASGRSTSHTYNTAGELLTRTFGDGTTVSYTYDDMGRRASMVDPTGTTTYTYGPAGRPIQIAAPSGTLGYGYDLAGRRTSLTYPDGTAATYTYDPAGRLTAVAEPSVGTVSYALDDDGRLTQTSLPNGQTRDFGYTDGRLTSHVDQGRATTIGYDDSGRIATLAGADNHTYTYDPAGQLLEAVQDNGTFAYTYGPRGEITSISDTDRTRSFDHNANVEITTVVDDAGNAGNATYDEAGRMVEHVDPDGTITSYGYDARGLLVEVVVTVPAEPGDPGPCAELTPTIVGTDGDDVLTGTNGVDIIFAGDGNDIIDGGNGADIICAGPGNDTIIGGNGADVIDAGPGDDHIDAGQGADTVTGGPGTDTLIGDKGDDVLAGGYGYDTIDGGQGDDICEDDNPTLCETLTPTAEPPAPSVTIESRTYDGDGTLTRIDITQPDGTTTTDDLLWDPTLDIPQVATWTNAGVPEDLLYGYRREAVGTVWQQHNALGDNIAAGSAWSPYGPAVDADSLSLGYRDEIETTTSVFLRARDLNASTASFFDVDPLEPVPGAPAFANPFHYADNDPINRSDPLGLRPGDADLVLGGFEYIAGQGYQLWWIDPGSEEIIHDLHIYSACYWVIYPTDTACGLEFSPEIAPFSYFPPDAPARPEDLISFEPTGGEFISVLGAGSNASRSLLRSLGISIGRWGKVKGHHILAKALFKGGDDFRAVVKNGLSISDDSLRSLGVNHQDITRAQQSLYSRFAASGQSLTIEGVAHIEYRALRTAGVPRDVAKALVREAVDDAIRLGTTTFTNIPWGGPIA